MYFVIVPIFHMVDLTLSLSAHDFSPVVELLLKFLC